MLANRDIKKGEIILKEFPAAIGPKTSSFPMCLGCHKLINLKPGERFYYKCEKCTWPLCGPACEVSDIHIKECEMMHTRKFRSSLDYDGTKKMESAYCVITPLRCMLLKNDKPEVFAKIMNLEDHLEERSKTQLYKILKSNIVTFMKNILGLKGIDEEIVMRIVAILDTNCFEIRVPNQASKLRGLYVSAAMMSHDCKPNTRHVFEDNYQMLLIASVDIPKGGIISTTYTQTLQGTLQRRLHLRSVKYFDCCCARCSDPTEFGTFIAGIICSRCKTGRILPTNPLNNQAVWKCNSCPHDVPARQVSWGNDTIMKEVRDLDRTSPKKFEEFIIKYQKTLHEGNTHIIQVKYALTQLYGNIPGFLMHELNDAGLNRKISLCRELLDLADILEPGFNHFRGSLLLDLQGSLAVQAKREFNNGLITKEAAQVTFYLIKKKYIF